MRASASRAPRRWRRRAHRARQQEQVAPVATMSRPSNHVPDVRRGPRGEHRGQRSLPPRLAGGVQGQASRRSAYAPARKSPPPRASQGRHGRRRSPPPTSRGAEMPAPPGHQALRSSSSGPLEQSDPRVPVAAQRERDPAARAQVRTTPSARSASVSGHMHTVDLEPASSSTFAGQVASRAQRGARPSAPASLEDLGGRAAEGGQALGSQAAAQTGARARRAVRARTCHDLRNLVGRTARTEWMAAPRRRGGASCRGRRSRSRTRSARPCAEPRRSEAALSQRHGSRQHEPPARYRHQAGIRSGAQRRVDSGEARTRF